MALRGFVEDIDDEIAGNQLFLLLNNAGPYTGGYTRVMYALSAGACLIAHSRLAELIPELVDDENCLLAGTPEAISDRIIRAARDEELRHRIGIAARQTYLDHFHPSRIAHGLCDMIGGSP